jgi:hypothetical protein
MPARGPIEPAQAEVPCTPRSREVPEYLRRMFPAEANLTPDEMQVLETLVMEYEDTFVGLAQGLGFTDLLTHAIDTGGCQTHKTRSLSLLLRGARVFQCRAEGDEERRTMSVRVHKKGAVRQ